MIDGIINKVFQEKGLYWKAMREAKALNTFHSCAINIPAYADFLAKAGITAEKIKTASDLQTVPPVGKDNYLRAYPFPKLMIGGSLSGHSVVFTSTSGSTGAPFYFPRTDSVDLRSSICHQLFLKNSLINANQSTLVIVCFGMGVWIGGIITYQAFKYISQRGYRLAIITPGVNKNEIFEALKHVAPVYNQVVLCGYPPFMKDIIDEAPSHGVDWDKLKIKMIFAAEAFSENFRDYIADRVGMKNVYRDTMNIYGSADLGTMAQESPVSILIRRLALANDLLYKKIFKEAGRLPTLAQFHPGFINFESVGNRVYCTSDNILPLVRYEIGDNGGVMDFDEMEQAFTELGLDLRKEVERAGLSDTLTELPFVYVYERSDLSVKLYGAIVYPEHVKAGLQNSELEGSLTGKFALEVKHDINQDEYLEVNVELKPGVGGTDQLNCQVSGSVLEGLIAKSAEYKNNFNTCPDKVRPKVVFWPYEDPTYFRPGAKQKWVKK
jgi:phenylacetate-CoA ligase